MPTDYSQKQADFYSKIADKGAACQVLQVGAKDVPTDPDKPWKGSNKEPARFDTFILVVPLAGDFSASARPGMSKFYLPAFGMNFRLTGDMSIIVKDKDGKELVCAISSIKDFAPDPAQVIFYEGMITKWVT